MEVPDPQDVANGAGSSAPRRGPQETDVHATADPGAAAEDGTDLEQGPDADPEGVARTIAIRQLTVRARTRHELAVALAKRQVPEAAAEAVLDRLDEVGLVDDGKFARDWVDSRQRRRHLSKSALRRELQAKGVDRETVDETLTAVAVDERSIALDLARRKVRSMSELAPAVRARRLAGALGRRGFSSSVVSSVVADLVWTADDSGSTDSEMGNLD